jgi:hypothetical protein
MVGFSPYPSTVVQSGVRRIVHVHNACLQTFIKEMHVGLNVIWSFQLISPKRRRNCVICFHKTVSYEVYWVCVKWFLMCWMQTDCWTESLVGVPQGGWTLLKKESSFILPQKWFVSVENDIQTIWIIPQLHFVSFCCLLSSDNSLDIFDTPPPLIFNT